MRNTSDKRVGVPSKLRRVTKNRNANQWISTPKQQKFIECWLLPESKTFGNAYKSAIEAGFSKEYAKIITAKHTNLEWVSEIKRKLTTLTPEHLIQRLQTLAMTTPDVHNQLRAIDMINRMQGTYAPQTKAEVNITFTNSVPRPQIIDVTELN